MKLQIYALFLLTLFSSAAWGQARRVPWANPDSVGFNSPNATKLEAQYGFAIGKGSTGTPLLPLTLSDHDLKGWDNAVCSTFYSGAGGPVDWSEIRIHSTPGGTTKWGIRAFDVWGWNFYRCTWDSIPKEHGCYFNAIGGARWEECYFGGYGDAEIGGQAIQVVYAVPGTVREHETGLNDSRIWQRLVASTVQNEWHEVYRCAIVNVGHPTRSERASFALSFFDPNGPAGLTGHPVRVSSCFIQTSAPWVDPNGQQRDCTGAIMAHKRRKVQILGTYISYIRGDRDVIQLWGNGDGRPETLDVLIKNCRIDASQPIDIRLDTPQDSIVIERNAGSAHVVVSTNPWYVWGNNGWDEKKVIYRGPITDNWRFNYE